jgi:chromate transporter
VALKNTVYALPRTDDAHEDFTWVLREIARPGGRRSWSAATLVEGLADADVEALFDAARSADYERISERAAKLDAALRRRSSLPRAAAELSRIEAQLATAVAIDFFEAPGREVAEGRIAAIAARIRASEPNGASAASPPGIDLSQVSGRTWVTRRGVHVDRIACAWLIRRFLDPEARFAFVAPRGYRAQPGEIRFDMYDAEFTPRGGSLYLRGAARCVGDQGCGAAGDRRGRARHRPEGRKVRPSRDPRCRAAARGHRARERDDTARLERGGSIFEDLYRGFGGERDDARRVVREALRVWTRVALNSFGGPTGQIAVMHRILVDEKRWISEERFLHALSYCMLLPGPEATQLATYVGWLLHRTRGGIAAGVLFVLPGFITILALSLIYTAWGDVPLVEGIFFGINRRCSRSWSRRCCGSDGARSATRHSWGSLRPRSRRSSSSRWDFRGSCSRPRSWDGSDGGCSRPRSDRPDPTPPSGSHAVADALLERDVPEHARPDTARAVRIAAVCLALWWAPIALLAAARGSGDVFTEIGVFFSKLAVVTFGGAYAVLAYMAQKAVEVKGWLSPREMLDGLGMAETTPGPLIQVVQFVGFLGAYRDPGALPPWLAGTLAAVLTTWVTYVPCFLWIFLGAPYVERLRESPAVRGALSGIMAAVVGVVLNLAIWFSLHTLFGIVNENRIGALVLQVPDPATIDFAAVAIALGAAVATLRFHVGMLRLIGVCAAAGVVWRSLQP